MLIFLTSLGATLFFGILQNTYLLSVAGIKPNLILVIALAYAFVEKDWLKRSAIILTALFTLAISPYGGIGFIITATALFLSVALVDTLPWKALANTLVALVLGTFVINLERFGIGIFTVELLYNFLAFALVGGTLNLIKYRFVRNV